MYKRQYLLIGFYAVVFTLAMFVSPDFWAIAFDSGGVTTGPMTVPFIMALGVGVSAVPVSYTHLDVYKRQGYTQVGWI